MTLRQYQIDLSKKGCDILNEFGIVYYAMEVRTGKTLTALNTAKLFGSKNVLFLTKKKAISSIQSDYNLVGFNFELTVINDESMHKVGESVGDFDLIIHDEHHRFGAFPKPSKGTRQFRDRFGHLPMIFLSGTPHPESYSQIYHQFWVSNRSPFKQWTSFYKWAGDFVNKKVKHLGHGVVNDWSEALIEKIRPHIDPYMITFTQEQAGFETKVVENVLNVKMSDRTYQMCDRLKKDLVIQGTDEVILADTGVKLMQKLHQMYSGTVKFESGNSMVIDRSKAYFICERFKSDKIAIFYKFKAELDMLKRVIGNKLTQDISEFDSDPDKWIALQIVSGREGTNLSSAKYLIYLNIDFSALSYFQSKDRLTTMDRKENDLFWIFSEGGIESKIYKTVQGKKDFTLSVFKKEML